MQESYLNKVVVFEYGTGCIPSGATCYCYRIDGNYFWVHFKEPILDRRDLRIHVNVINEHGKIVGI